MTGERETANHRLRSTGMFYATRLLSQAGQGVFVAGLFVLAGQQNSTAVGLSSVLVAMMLGSILLGLPGGALADRLGAPRALVAGAAGRTIAIVAALLLSGRPEMAALIAFLYSAFSQVYSPSEMALVRAVAPERPAGAHALLVALQHAGQGAGVVVLGPIAYVMGGAEAMVGTGLVMYLGVTGLAAVILVSGAFQKDTRAVRKAFTFGGTLRYLAREPHAVYAGSLLAFSEMAAKAMAIALPLYLAEDLRLSDLEPAALLLPGAIGAGLGLLWASRALHLHIAPQVMRLTLAGAVISAVALAGLGNGLAAIIGFAETGPFHSLQNATHLSVAVAVPIALLLGACFVVAPIGARTVLTATAPRGEQGRVFATQSTFSDVLTIAPIALAGVGAELAGARFTFLFVGIVGAALLVGLELLRMRRGGDSLLEPQPDANRPSRPGFSEA